MGEAITGLDNHPFALPQYSAFYFHVQFFANVCSFHLSNDQIPILEGEQSRSGCIPVFR